MPQHCTEPFFPDRALSNVFVAVHMARQSFFRIIHVNELNPGQSDRLLQLFHQAVNSFPRSQIITRREGMAGVKTHAKPVGPDAIQKIPELRKLCSNLTALACRILQQQPRGCRMGLERLSKRAADPLKSIGLARLHTAHMEDEKIRTHYMAPFQFVTESQHGFLIEDGIGGSEVDEIGRVHGERPDPELFTELPGLLDVGEVQGPCRPAARTFRENLHGPASEAVRALNGLGQTSRNANMDADS
jgi:hypothetical protein